MASDASSARLAPAYPVYVCVPASRGEVLMYGECWPDGDYRNPEPVGLIRDLWVSEFVDTEMLSRDGYDVKLFVRQVKSEHGCVRALIMAAIEAPTWEAAARISGFLPLGDFTGSFYPPPKAAAGFNRACYSPDDYYDGVPCVRLPVSEAYDHFEPPPYDKDGAYVLSMITRGQIGCFVFLDEDQLGVYSVPTRSDNGIAISVARQCLLKGLEQR